MVTTREVRDAIDGKNPFYVLRYARERRDDARADGNMTDARMWNAIATDALDDCAHIDPFYMRDDAEYIARERRIQKGIAIVQSIIDGQKGR